VNVAYATALAERAHAGQVDKAGQPYIGHLRRVSTRLRPYGVDAQIAGVLHDILEDTEVTAGDLVREGVPHHVIAAIESVTRIPGETYMDLVHRAAAHPLGRLVKLADNLDNADEERLKALDPVIAARLRAKYARAREVLENEVAR
jgi:(p)ppGpp synthase/HD superfamily hydrolase